jgi:hypothetical protein
MDFGPCGIPESYAWSVSGEKKDMKIQVPGSTFRYKPELEPLVRWRNRDQTNSGSLLPVPN